VVHVVMHEMMHILAFNPPLFEYFTNLEGEKYDLNEIYKKTQFMGLSTYILCTP